MPLVRLGGQTGMTRDPWLLYGADIRKRILDEVAAEIARLAARRKVGRLVSVGIGDADHGAVADIASWTTPLLAGLARSRWQC